MDPFPSPESHEARALTPARWRLTLRRRRAPARTRLDSTGLIKAVHPRGYMHGSTAAAGVLCTLRVYVWVLE